MSSYKKTHFLTPSWDIPPSAVSLGSLLADPTAPHQPINSTAALRPNANASSPAPSTPNVPQIDTPVFSNNFAPYSTTLSTSAKNAFSLTAQLSLLFGLGGNVSASRATDSVTAYHFESLESEWFVPSAEFIAAMLAVPSVADVLNMLPRRQPVYMITGVRRVTGIQALSSIDKQRSVGAGFNADATAAGVPVAAGIDAERGRGNGNTVEWECAGPVVFSYQLVKLKRRNGRWAKEEHTKGAMMGVGEKSDEVIESERGDVVDDLDGDEVEVRHDGWDEVDGGECRVVVPVQV